MTQRNAIKEKSMEFAVRIVRLSEYLRRKKDEAVMSKQLLRSGTSIGANVREAIYAQSRRDILSKMSIALKEASETEYWLELLKRTGYLSTREYERIGEESGEIARMLTAIVKSTKEE